KNLTELNLGLHQLEKLYINQNNIKTIPENVFPSLEKLKFLKLSTNRLEKLPQDMNRCQHLNYLNLSNNCLRNLDPLVGLSHLKELYVERNQLVLDLVPIDCTKKEDIVKLGDHIKSEVLNKATFPSIEQTLPRSYYEVEKDIKELLKNGDIAEHGQFYF
uniref:Uncharacterized protein n=1 Tax=Cyprinus carpio TaxID=7962 RepID=A0A8C1DFX8_CYPCA